MKSVGEYLFYNEHVLGRTHPCEVDPAESACGLANVSRGLNKPVGRMPVVRARLDAYVRRGTNLVFWQSKYKRTFDAGQPPGQPP